MSHWYEVFDDEQVQFVTRKQVATLSFFFFASVALTGAAFAIGQWDNLPTALTGGFILLAWLVMIRWASRRLRSLRRIMWCLKLSDRRLVGYDYARRKTSLDWTHVERVELVRKGLRIYGPPPCYLEIPTLFPDFATLSHRIVSYAEFYEVPVFVDGQPWQSLDVYALYPFLLDDASSDLPGALEA